MQSNKNIYNNMFGPIRYGCSFCYKLRETQSLFFPRKACYVCGKCALKGNIQENIAHLSLDLNYIVVHKLNGNSKHVGISEQKNQIHDCSRSEQMP